MTLSLGACMRGSVGGRAPSLQVTGGGAFISVLQGYQVAQSQ